MSLHRTILPVPSHPPKWVRKVFLLIVDRTIEIVGEREVNRLGMMMDLAAVHDAFEMDWTRLLAASDVDFHEEMIGIRDHLDRSSVTFDEDYTPCFTVDRWIPVSSGKKPIHFAHSPSEEEFEWMDVTVEVIRVAVAMRMITATDEGICVGPEHLAEAIGIYLANQTHELGEYSNKSASDYLDQIHHRAKQLLES